MVTRFLLKTGQTQLPVPLTGSLKFVDRDLFNPIDPQCIESNRHPAGRGGAGCPKR